MGDQTSCLFEEWEDINYKLWTGAPASCMPRAYPLLNQDKSILGTRDLQIARGPRTRIGVVPMTYIYKTASKSQQQTPSASIYRQLE